MPDKQEDKTDPQMDVYCSCASHKLKWKSKKARKSCYKNQHKADSSGWFPLVNLVFFDGSEVVFSWPTC